jgi:predicted deacylase
MAEVFGIEHVMHPKDLPGTTFKAAAALNIPCIIAEAGQCGQLDEESTRRLMQGCINVAQHLGIVSGKPAPAVRLTVFRDYPWVCAEHTGCWYPAVGVGEVVRCHQRMGSVRDYFGNVLAEYFAPADGTVLLLGTSLAVNTGDPLFGIGVV